MFEKIFECLIEFGRKAILEAYQKLIEFGDLIQKLLDTTEKHFK